MKIDVRNTLQHVGDLVVGAVEKTIDAGNRCAQGVALTYDINDLSKKKRSLLADICERLTQVTKEGLTDVRRDDKLMELFSKLEAMEKTIQDQKNQRDTAKACCSKKNTPEPKASEMNAAETAAS